MLAAAAVTVAAAGCGGDRQLVGLTRDPEPVVDVAPVPDVSRGGEPFRFVAGEDGLLVVFFGYTNCPDVCPTTLVELRRGLDQLDASEAEQIDAVMVSIDPDRDREVLADYIDSFVPDGHAVATDDDPLLQQIALAFGVSYQVTTRPNGDVDVAHSDTGLFAVDDTGTLVLTWPYGTDSDDIAGDLEQLLADRGMNRVVAVAIASAAVLVPTGVAHADPAVPTDFATEVVGIEPATPSIEVGVVGGDSFVELTVAPGTEIVVLGYWGEPYLRFNGNGTVEENRRSPTVAENESRYGGSSPAGTGATGESQWAEVATDGSYAWHDHRAHWMSDEPPVAERGDEVLTGVIPLQVDGATVEVSVAVVWEPAPSPVALVAGAVVAGFAVMVVLSIGRRVAWVLALTGAAAAGIGWWQVVSVPPETGPSSIAWLLPAIASAVAIVAITLGRSLVSYALVTLSGLQLAMWAFLRRDGLVKALLPTDAPFWLDRGVTAAAAVVGLAGIAAGALGMVRLPAAEG